MCPDEEPTEPLSEDSGAPRRKKQPKDLESLRPDETWPELEDRTEATVPPTQPLGEEATWPEVDTAELEAVQPGTEVTEPLEADETWPEKGADTGAQAAPSGEEETLRPEDLLEETAGEEWTTISERGGGTSARKPADETVTDLSDRTGTQDDPSRTPVSTGGMATRATTAHGQGPKSPQPRPKGGETGMQVFAGRFEVEDVLGEGGMGKVYRVRDRQIEGREVALKVLRPKYSKSERFRELFFKEIHAAQNFVSEHVNQVRDTGQMHDGQLFLTMDLVEGESLASLLKREGALATPHALEITRQMLAALGSGHDKGFIHRDVKPGNVMLASGRPRTEENPFGVGVRLLDFGIAAIGASLEEGSRAGTPRYMSPEQVSGERLDPRSDLFAVGVVLYRMLCGKLPFEGKTLEEVKTSILEVDVSASIGHLDNVPAPVRKLLAKSLHKNRDKRFQSAGDFADAIGKLQDKRESGGVPGWIGVLTFLFAAAAGVLGFLYYDQLQASRVSEENLTTRIESEEGDREEEIARLEATIEEQVREIEQLLTEDEVETRVREEILAWQRESDWEKKRDFFDQWYTKVEGGLESERIPIQLERMSEELKQVQEALAQLQKRNDELERQDSPVIKQGAGYEAILTYLDQGYPGEARTRLDSLVRDTIFEKAGGEGSQLLDTMIRAYLSLDTTSRKIQEPGVDIAGDLSNIETLLDRARRSLQLLSTIDPAWLTTPERIDDQIDPKQLRILRLDMAERLLDGWGEDLVQLQTQGEQVVVDQAAKIANDWTAFLAAPPETDPTDAIAFADTYSQDLTPLLAGYVKYLNDKVLTEDIFPLDELRSEAALPVWGQLIEGKRDALASSPLGLEMRLIWAATRWYDRQIKPRQLKDELSAFRTLFTNGPRKASPHYDWRLQFMLQAAALTDQPDWLTDGWQAIYQQRFSDGAVWWWKHDGRHRGLGQWDVQREHYTPGNDRTAKQEKKLVVRLSESGELTIDGELRLDAYQLGTQLRVGIWKPILPTPDGDPRWARNLDFERFAGETEDSPQVCLIVETPDYESWFSPKYGLVREIKRGRYPIERELAFRQSNR